MNRLLLARNNILVEETPQVPLNFGEIQAQNDIKQFEENLHNIFSDDEEFIFEKRTREALERVECRGVNAKSKSQFLEELYSW